MGIENCALATKVGRREYVVFDALDRDRNARKLVNYETLGWFSSVRTIIGGRSSRDITALFDVLAISEHNYLSLLRHLGPKISRFLARECFDGRIAASVLRRGSSCSRRGCGLIPMSVHLTAPEFLNLHSLSFDVFCITLLDHWEGGD